MKYRTLPAALIPELEEHPDSEVVISRDGRPVASLVAYERSSHSADARIGSARGEFRIPDGIGLKYPATGSSRSHASTLLGDGDCGVGADVRKLLVND